MAIQIKHVKAELKKKTQEAKGKQADHAKMQKQHAAKTAALDKLEAELAKMKYDPEARPACEASLRKLKEVVLEKTEKRDKLRSVLSAFSFEHHMPNSFDSKKIKGMVAKLIEVKEEKTSTALEVTAGGRLYNVVVDTEETGKALLQKGKLKKRVTIIPLSQITRRSIDPKAVSKAEQLVGADNARVALSLVGYDQEVSAAMQYVFGRTFVCTDSDSAKKVTFDPAIKVPSVTLQGDVFDPSGTLSGGSTPAGGSVLLKLQTLNEMEAEVASAHTELKSMTAKLKTLTQLEDKARHLLGDKEVWTHECALLSTRMASSDFATLQADVTALNTQVEEITTGIKDSKEAKVQALAKAASLERAIKDFEKERKAQLKKQEQALALAKKTLAAMVGDVAKQEQHTQQLQMELTSLMEERKQTEAQIEQQEVKVKEAQAKVEELAQGLAETRKEFETVQARLDAEKGQLQHTEQAIAEATKSRDALTKQLTDIELSVKKLKHSISRSHADEAAAKAKVAQMLKEHEWIKEDRHLFGKPHSDYDFDTGSSGEKSIKANKARLRKLQSEQEALGRRINRKVMGMFEKAETEYAELVRKRDIILQDKSKIEQVIAQLDIKKNEALQSTWQKVNRDLGSIFSALLPGAMAKVEPPAGMSVLDGLELRVAFGGAWKESLSELSGGQRSLLALSLILALLLFKPAPMYILDEIDAALDLSHTQNIGVMLKTHFPQSQFIVVSLKEGMFNNANVIFRTQFVDGVSTVGRSVNKPRDVPKERTVLGSFNRDTNKRADAASSKSKRKVGRV